MFYYVICKESRIILGVYGAALFNDAVLRSKQINSMLGVGTIVVSYRERFHVGEFLPEAKNPTKGQYDAEVL